MNFLRRNSQELAVSAETGLAVPNTTPIVTPAFGRDSGIEPAAFGALMQKPGYRVAFDLATDLIGQPETWDYDEIYGRNVVAKTPASKHAALPTEQTYAGTELAHSTILPAPRPRDATRLLTEHINQYGYKNTADGRDDAIKELIALNAPNGRQNLVWDLYGKLSKNGDYKGSVRELCHGTSIVVYLQSLVSLHFVGPKSAYKRLHEADDRDNYPVWYGHFNQVIGEVADVAVTHVGTQTSLGINALLGSMKISDPAGRMIGDRDYHEPYGREKTAEVVISNVPWHPRRQEAQQAMWKNASFKY